MTLLTPNWLQAGSYPARYDRLLIEQAFGERELVFTGLQVTQNGGGALNVNIAAGKCSIMGDDQANQGMYVVVNDGTVNLAMPAVPGSNKRIDLICVRVNDPNAGGPAGDNASFVVTQGSVSATPSAPATPTSAIVIARVLRTAGDAAVLTAHITDVAMRGIWPYTVSSSPAPALMPPNYLWVQV